MTRPVFLADDLDPAANALAVGDRAVLGGPEGRHAKVQRLQPGQELDVVDGAGLRLTCVVTQGPDVSLEVVAVVREPVPTPRLTLVQALAKGGRDEQAIETATEIGVDRIIPWQANRSIVRWDAKKRAKAQEKWRNVIVSSTKQSRRAWTPELGDVVDSGQLAALVGGVVGAGGRVLVCHETATTRLAEIALDSPEIVVVVGPEGGIDEGELGTLTDAGADVVLLGPHVLRSASAGPAALTLLSAATGRW